MHICGYVSNMTCLDLHMCRHCVKPLQALGLFELQNESAFPAFMC